MNPLLAGKYFTDLQPVLRSGTQKSVGLGTSPSAFDFETLINQAPEAERPGLRTKLIESQIESAATREAIAPFFQQPFSLEELEGFREREAKRAQQLGKESLWQAGAAHALFKGIPQTISEAFARNAAINREAGYAIPATYANTFNAMVMRPY